MKKIRDVLLGIFNVLYRVLLEYSKYVLLVIVAVVTIDVVSRNVATISVVWAQEVSLLLIVWMTFLSMAVGVEKDCHIGIELFYNLMPKVVQRFLDKLNKFILMCVGCFLAYYGYGLAASTWSSSLAVTKWPAGMLYLMIPVGGACIAYFSLLDLLGWKQYKKTHQYEDTPDIVVLPEGEGKPE